MEVPEGMVAVVRGLPDAALAVTLMEGGRHYTLMPNNIYQQQMPAYAQQTQVPVHQIPVQHMPVQQMPVQQIPVQQMPAQQMPAQQMPAPQMPAQQLTLRQMPIHHHMQYRRPPAADQATGTDTNLDTKPNIQDSTVQATDGRYTSVYKMEHCKLTPTSPPVQLTEFPPQRPELCKGQGNFQVGGLGSGESSFSPIRANGTYRGGLCWPDRGSVFTPRPSQEPNAFANSLRKYPNLSPDRSTEMVERLINYTQTKNAKNQYRKDASPTRSEARSESSSTQNYERLRNGRSQRSYDQEYSARPKVDESPTRDGSRDAKYDGLDFPEFRKTLFSKNYDTRHFRDPGKSLRDPYSHPVCPTIKVSNNLLPPVLTGPDPRPNIMLNKNGHNSVNMETQAKISMVSREAATLPKAEISTKNVAVPLTPISSLFNAVQIALDPSEIKNKYSSKSIQTNESMYEVLQNRKSVQTCLSTIELSRKMKKVKRKTKSQEELRTSEDFEEEVIQLIKDMSLRRNGDSGTCIRNSLVRKIRKYNRIGRGDRIKIRFGKCVREQIHSDEDLQRITSELSSELLLQMKKRNKVFNNYNFTNVFRAEIRSQRSNEEMIIEKIVTEWMQDIPLKTLDYLGKCVKKDDIVRTLTSKIFKLIKNNSDVESYKALRSNIFEIIEDIPIEISEHGKIFYLHKIVSDLLKRLESHCLIELINRKKRALPSTENAMYLQPIHLNEKNLDQLIRKEISEFSSKFDIKITPETFKILRTEIYDIIVQSLDTIRFTNCEKVKEELRNLLSDFIKVYEHEALYFVNNLIQHLKMFIGATNKTNLHKTIANPLIVLRNTAQNLSNNTDYSIEPLTNEDINANIEFYTNQIIAQVKEWMLGISCLQNMDSEFLQTIAKDLAGDIVDRHKFLEFNVSSQGRDVDELEHLKYQIFKWINKAVDEENLETIDEAQDLMKRIKSIPVPMIARPNQSINFNSNPSYLEKQEEIIKSFSGATNTLRGPSRDCVSIPGSSNQAKYERELIDSTPCKNQCESETPPINIIIQSKKCCDAGTMPCSVNNKNNDENVKQILEKHNIMSSISVLSTAQEKTANETQNTVIKNIIYKIQGTSMIEKQKERQIAAETQQSQLSHFTSGISSADNASKTSQIQTKNIRDQYSIQSNTENKSVSPNTTKIEQLNDEYDNFLTKWVKEIPIATSSAEEEALAEKARLGIYNGIWKAITKLKMNPATLNNPFYYQDVLDDEIEDLLGMLPQTPDLLKTKDGLKSKLVEKTTNMNDQIIAAASPSFKQQLVENISNKVPRKTIDHTGQDVAKVFEELQKLNLAEDFIMYTNYKDTDMVKANVYKNKLLKHIQEFIDGLKRSSGKELKDIDAATYKKEIMETLFQVPLPSDETIRAEADEILLGMEIEQWFSDLPLYPTSDNIELLARRRYRDNLAKTLHDMGENKNINENDEELRNEILKFLERLPLRTGEAENINFMVEELVNRLKNRPKDIDILAGSTAKRKSVGFSEPNDYDEFSRNMQLCSSFSDDPNAKRAQINESSYMIVDGKKVDNYTDLGPYVQTRQKIPASQQEWLTLDETKKPIIIKDYNQDKNGKRRSSVKGKILPSSYTQQDTSQPSENAHLDRSSTSSRTPRYTQTQENRTRGPSLSYNNRPQTAESNLQSPESFRGSDQTAQNNRETPENFENSLTQTRESNSQIPKNLRTSLAQTEETNSQTAENFGNRLVSARTSNVQSPESFRNSLAQTEPTNRQTPENFRNSFGQRRESNRQTPGYVRNSLAQTIENNTLNIPRVENQYIEYQDNDTDRPLPYGSPRSNRFSKDRSYREKSYGPSTSSGPTADHGPEISTRPLGESGRSPSTQEAQSAERRTRYSLTSKDSPEDFSRSPKGFSTPRQNIFEPKESRPKKKKSKDIAKSKADVARRRLELDEDTDSDTEDMRCRCMEKMWRCPKKLPFCYPYEDFGFPPCYPVGYPYCFYK